MRLTITRTALLDALAIATRHTDPRSTIPILAAVRLSAAGGAVVVAATDQEKGCRLTVAAEIAAPGECVVGGKLLLDVAKSLDGETVTLATDGRDRIIVTAGRAKLTLATLDPHEFPEPPKLDADASGIEADAGELAAVLSRVQRFQSRDESRVTLCGVYVESGEGVTVSATDGHRLITVQTAMAGAPGAVLLPRHALEAWLPAMPDGGAVRLSWRDGVAWLDCGASMLLWARLVEGGFPDYRQVIPKKAGPTRATVDVAAMTAALRRVRVVASDRTHGVKVSIGEDGVQAMTLNPDVGEATDAIEANVSGPAACFGVNADYLIDALLAAGETARIAMTDEESPVLVTATDDDGVRCIAMPMRLT